MVGAPIAYPSLNCLLRLKQSSATDIHQKLEILTCYPLKWSIPSLLYQYGYENSQLDKALNFLENWQMPGGTMFHFVPQIYALNYLPTSVLCKQFGPRSGPTKCLA